MINPIKLEQNTSIRKGENKLGEFIFTCSEGEWQLALKTLPEDVRFCLVGIPESIGILGNYGRTGAEFAWETFLNHFLNIQHNRFLLGSSFFVLGAIDVSDLQDRAVALQKESGYNHQKLHDLCDELDERVEAVMSQILQADIVPIVIGGGHNNAYALLKAASLASSIGRVNAINMDAHADFRQLEGRHSGNAFSYAMHKRYLNRYFVLGLHQSYNAEFMLRTLDAREEVMYTMFEDIESLDETLSEAIHFMADDTIKTGLELDMDAICFMPSSASSPSGFSMEEARSYVKKCASLLNVAYLHLPEAAPQNERDALLVGKALAYLVSDFAKAFLKRKVKQ